MLRETLLWRRIQTRDPKSCRYIGLVIFFKVYPLVKGRDDRKLLVLDDILQASSTADTIGVDVGDVVDKNAMLIYTSGTTGSPKGVVMTHRVLNAQIDNLVRAWNYSTQVRNFFRHFDRCVESPF